MWTFTHDFALAQTNLQQLLYMYQPVKAPSPLLNCAAQFFIFFLLSFSCILDTNNLSEIEQVGKIMKDSLILWVTSLFGQQFSLLQSFQYSKDLICQQLVLFSVSQVAYSQIIYQDHILNNHPCFSLYVAVSGYQFLC